MCNKIINRILYVAIMPYHKMSPHSLCGSHVITYVGPNISVDHLLFNCLDFAPSSDEKLTNWKT
jgi:hypothetical protein